MSGLRPKEMGESRKFTVESRKASLLLKHCETGRQCLGPR